MVIGSERRPFTRKDGDTHAGSLLQAMPPETARLQCELLELRQRLAAAEAQARIYELAVQHISTGLYILHLEDHENPASLRLIAANAAASQLSGFDVMAEIGKPLMAIYPNGLETGLVQTYAAVARNGGNLDLGEVQYGDDRVTASFFAVRAIQIDQDYACVLVENVTQRKQAEEARSQAIVQEAMIQAQQATLLELSTPLIPVTEGVIVMPLIGAIDTARAERVMNSLLQGIAAHQAEFAILDITGVRTVDTVVASALLRTAGAAMMLGSRVLLTGIRAESALALVQLQADLGSLVTLGTLQQGIAYALAHSRKKRDRAPRAR